MNCLALYKQNIIEHNWKSNYIIHDIVYKLYSRQFQVAVEFLVWSMADRFDTFKYGRYNGNGEMHECKINILLHICNETQIIKKCMIECIHQFHIFRNAQL